MKKLLYIFAALFSAVVNAQTDQPCTGPFPVATPVLVGPTCSYQTASLAGLNQQTNPPNGGVPGCGAIGEDGWFSFIAPVGGEVNFFSLPGTTTDAVAAIYSGTCGTLTEIACNDDSGPGLMPEMTVTGLTPGVQYFLRVWEFGGGSGTFDFCLSIPLPPPPNFNCANSEPICSGSPINFTAQAGGSSADVEDPGNDYGCLFTSPNPSWYYLEIATGGNLVIDITAGSDIDYAMWGPFPSVANAQANCNTYGPPIDCSYSTAAVEQANVPGAIAGEVYILLVTNFANTPQFITVVEAGINTATTDCSIVPLPIELVDFSATEEEGGIALSWTTASERNNKLFEVQRRNDKGFFETIAVKPGAGNSNSSISYEAKDKNPNPETNYYRLKQTDIDGEFTFSDIISVSNTISLSDINLYPNPSTGKFMVKSKHTMNTVRVLNVEGRVEYEKNEVDDKQYYVEVQDLKPGVYFIEIQTNLGMVKDKIIIR